MLFFFKTKKKGKFCCFKDLSNQLCVFNYNLNLVCELLFVINNFL